VIFYNMPGSGIQRRYMENKFYRYQAFPFFLAILSIYILLIIYLDNTNITTSNGFYKSIDSNGWEKGTRHAVDSGGLLYAFSMGMISKFIPDSLVSFYGEVTNFVAYRKLAWINSFFGAASSTVVQVLAYQVTKDKIWSLGTAFVHAFSAFILINSIISEDIIPGYFFFVLSFLFLYKALEGSHVRLFLAGSTLSVIAMMLLHWSLFPPLAASYFVVLCFLTYHERAYLRFFFEQFFILIVVLYIFSKLATFFASGKYNIDLSVWSILYPNKAGPGSWVGFDWIKLACLYEGVGNYLIGGKNVGVPFSGDFSHVIRNIISWSITLSSVVFLLIMFFKEEKKNLKIIALFGLSIFFFGECQNLYGQPQDPQFQVQPMFILTTCLICLNFLRPAIKNSMRIVMLVFALIIGIDNFVALQPYCSGDGIMVRGYKEFRDHFPKDSTKIVHLAYEGWSPWLMLFDYEGDFKVYLKDVTCLNTPFHFTPGISVKDGAQQIMSDIDAALALGKRVIVTVPWVDPDYIYALRAQNLTKDQTIELRKILLEHYQIKSTYKLKWGEFAEIEKRKSND